MKKLFYPVLALLAVSMASCTNNDEPINTDNDGQVEIKATAGIAEILTKAGAGELTAFNATAVGVYGVKEGNEADSYVWTASPYYKSSTPTITGADLIFTDKLYYPTDDKKVKLFAYLPVTDGTVTEPTEGNAPTIKYTLDGKTDILYSSAVTGNLSTQNTVALAFKHKLAKLSFIVKADASFSTGTNVTSITVTGINNTATLDLGTGTVSFNSENTDNIVAFSGTQAIETASSAALGSVLIQPGQKFGLTIVAGGVTYTLSDIEAIPVNTAHVLTLTFKPTEVTGSASIGEWIGSTGSTDVAK